MATNSSAVIVPATPPAPTNAVAGLKDIKPPVDIPDFWIYVWIGLGFVLLALVAFLIWRFWLKGALAPKPVPVVPPHVRARRKLKEAMAYINEPKLFVSAVSDAIRIYLEESFNLRAPESTTEEFLYALQTSNRLAGNVKGTLGDFLTRCDLVKFAKYEPTQLELEELHSVAMKIIEETEPQQATPTSQLVK